jgi:hypothetical protein
VPSERAAAVSRWIVAFRLPAARFSSRRVNAQRTGRPVRLDSSAAMKVWSLAPFFEPKPPPMNSQTTRTLSGARPRAAATSSRTPQMLWVEM